MVARTGAARVTSCAGLSSRKEKSAHWTQDLLHWTCKQEAHFVPALEALTPWAVTWDGTTHALEGERVKSFVLRERSSWYMAHTPSTLPGQQPQAWGFGDSSKRRQSLRSSSHSPLNEAHFSTTDVSCFSWESHR